MSDFRLEELSEELAEAFLAAGFASDSLLAPGVVDVKAFQKFAKACAKERLDWRPGPKKTSLSRYLLFTPQGAVGALGLMRFPLDEKTEVDGGNLVVEVPLALRGRGYGSVCLSLLLFEAVRAGMRRVLATCSSDDGAACKVIERNRGVVLDQKSGVRRYWINFG